MVRALLLWSESERSPVPNLWIHEAEAERQLASARERAGSVLAGGQSVAIATQSNGRTVFRARFAGFDAARAASVCTELRRKQIDCLVAKAE